MNGDRNDVGVLRGTLPSKLQVSVALLRVGVHQRMSFAAGFTVPEKTLRPCLSLNPTPLVIVEGFLGGANAAVWGNFEEYLNCDSKTSTSPSNCKRRSIFARYAARLFYPYISTGSETVVCQVLDLSVLCTIGRVNCTMR